MLTVAICQFNRNEPDFRGVELEAGARSGKNWPASISNKRRRRRKKTRKTKARDPDVTINLESEEVEEVESFEEDVAPLQIDGVSTGGGTGSGKQHVDVPKVSGSCRILCSATRCGVQQLHVLCSCFRRFIPFASTSCSSSYSLCPLFIANAMQIKFIYGSSLKTAMNQFRGRAFVLKRTIYYWSHAFSARCYGGAEFLLPVVDSASMVFSQSLAL